MFPKPKRIENKKLIEELKKLPCVACGIPGPSDTDHIMHRGSGNDDTIDNCWPLCRTHHSMKHQIGIRRFAQRFPTCLEWLKRHRGHEDIINDVLKMIHMI